jgi:hypothetical protein
MRRRVAVMTAVLVGLVAGAGAVAIPAGAAVNTREVSAASEPSVTIKGIDREGKAVPVSASLESAGSFGFQQTLSSSHATKVPAGSYNIAAWVWEPDKKAATLVDHAVTITASATVTFDARPGKQLRFTVNDSTVSQAGALAEPFDPATGQWAMWNNSFGPVDGSTVYLVPGALPSGWDLFLQANLVRPEPGGTASPVEYELTKLVAGSIPSNLTFPSSKAGLAQDHVTDRDWGQGTDGLMFAPHPVLSTGGGMTTEVPSVELGQQNFLVPASIDVYFSPGSLWESVDFAASDDVYGTPLLAGHTYSQTFGAAVFSPSPLFGPTLYGNTLASNETFGNSILVDAGSGPADNASVGLWPTDPQGWLYEGSKLIKHVSGYGANFVATIPATTQTYTMKVEADRVSGNNVPLDGMAKSVTAVYVFTAKAGQDTLSASNFWPRIVPQGLSLRDAAAGGSRTAVPITFDTTSGPIAAHDVAVWASVNGGKTWTALKVGHSGSTWTVTVANPNKAGYVSLKVQGENAAGFKATVTLINAYVVS